MNCELSHRLNIDFQVMPRKDSGPRGVVKDVVRRFDKKAYRRRKNGDREVIPFDRLKSTRFRMGDSREIFVTVVAVAVAIRRLIMLERMLSMFTMVRLNEIKKAKC